MFELIGHMEIRAVTGFGLPHFPKDLQPALTQASQSRSVAFAFGS